MDLLSTITALFQLITKGLPSDEERLQRLKAKFPLIVARKELKAQKIKAKQLQAAKAFVLKHDINPYEFARYLGGDSTLGELIKSKPNQ